jgi:hypothetical protein
MHEAGSIRKERAMGKGRGRTGCRAAALLIALVLVFGLVRWEGPVSSHEGPSRPPFRRALVLSALGPDGVVYLGVYDAAVDAGYQPDVIIASSGGAMAAALIAAFPDRSRRCEFVTSECLHSLLLATQIEQDRLGPLMGRYLGWTARAVGPSHQPPRVFDPPIVCMPSEFPVPELNQLLPVGPRLPRTVFVASQLEYGPCSHGPADRKYFSEAWLTDCQTAPLLADLPSPIGQKYPHSTVRPQPVVVTGVRIADALRASVSEPYFFSPLCLGDRCYLGAAIDLYPFELARCLAEEVAVPLLVPHTSFEGVIVESVFGFSQQRRQRETNCQPADVRIDLRDIGQALRGASFWFTLLKVHQGPGGACPSYLVPRCRLVTGVPAELEEFRRRIRVQWSYGYEKGKRAFSPNGCPRCSPPEDGFSPP